MIFLYFEVLLLIAVKNLMLLSYKEINKLKDHKIAKLQPE